MTQDRAALTAQIAGLTRLADVGDTIPGAGEHVAVLREKITDLRAQLAALDAEPEPDWEAWRPALEAAYASRGEFFVCPPHGSETEKSVIRSMIAAFAHAPLAQGGVEQSAEDFADYLAQFYDQRAGAWRSKIIRAIIERDRTTLARVPVAGWPNDLQKWGMVDEAIKRGAGSPEDIALAMFDLLKARMTAGGEAKSGHVFASYGLSEPSIKTTSETRTEPAWLDWHGGECPVPAGTRVEVRFQNGEIDKEIAGHFSSGACNWWKWEGRKENRIIAYRILPAGEQSA